MENLGTDQDPLEDVKFDLKPVALDFQRLIEMPDSEKGHSNMQCLVKHWEYKRATDVQVLEEELDLLCQQRKEIEQKIGQKRQQILEVEEQRIHDESSDTVKERVPVLDEGKTTHSRDQELKTDAEDDNISYWKERAMQLEETLYKEHKTGAECDIVSFWKERVMQLEEKLKACLQKECLLVEKTEGSIRNSPSQTQFEGFSGLLKRADSFLHLILQSAPIVIAHQDVDLRYRFIFNHYPTLADEDVIGKTDYEIYSGEGIEEMHSVKREVMATGIATKREFVLNTPMFGAKTFLTYIEPVFSKGAETIGVNHVAMDITDQETSGTKINVVAQSMWPENIGDKHQRQFIMEKFRKDQDAFKDVKFDEKPAHVDFQRLMEMANTEKGVSHMQYFMKHWEYKRANAARLLEEELGLLSQQRKEIEQNKQQILEEQRFQDESYYAVKRHVPILDEAYEDERKRPSKKNDELSHNRELKIDAHYDSVAYWKERETQLEKTLEEIIQRERSLAEKLEENIKNLQSHTPAEEFSGMLKRADYFLHLILQSAPIVIAHQDADLRYRFIFNHYPTLADEDVIGKTDYEIYSGEGIEEMHSVKREVMATGIATKREFVLNTPMFGAKTFLTYIEPVFSKGGETIGVNHVAMDITDQVKRREKMADIRVREAIQNAKERENGRSLHITGQKEK